MPTSLYPTGARLSRSLFDRERDAYSATDIEAVVMGTDKSTGRDVVVRIGDIQTLTYSSHRDMAPVRTLGRSNPVVHVAGQRTIAGSLIFATFNKRALSELYTGAANIPLEGTLPDGETESISSARILKPTDTVPPFDIVLYFSSEAGNDSVMFIYRVQIFTEGQTFSVQDIYTEHTMQYVAGGVSMMEKVDDVWLKSAVGEQAVFANARLIRRAQATGLDI